MTQTIRLKMIDEKVKVSLSEGVLTQSTVKSLFLLPPDAVVSLWYEVNGEMLGTRLAPEPTFLLPHDWATIESFTVKSDKAPSRSATPITEDSRPTTPQADEEEFASSFHHLLYFMPANQAALRNSRYSDDPPPSPKPDDYVDGGCVTPISSTAAVTYQHRSHKFLHVYKEGDTNERSIVEIRKTLDTNVRYKMKVIVVDEKHDFILLRSLDNSNIFEYSYPWSLRCPKNFEWFVGFGLSHRTERGSHVTHRSGHICSDKPDYRGRFKADSSIDDGDSGGPCFSKNRALIGILVSSTTSSPNLSTDYQKSVVETEIGTASCHPGDSLIAAGSLISEAFGDYLVSTGEELVGGETNPLKRDVLKRRLLQSEGEVSAKRRI